MSEYLYYAAPSLGANAVSVRNTMKIIKATKTVNIWGTNDAWSLKPEPGSSQACTKCSTDLTILGNKKNGYHLVMSPEGFFTADYWFESKQEAMESAERLFGVAYSEWSQSG